MLRAKKVHCLLSVAWRINFCDVTTSHKLRSHSSRLKINNVFELERKFHVFIVQWTCISKDTFDSLLCDLYVTITLRSIKGKNKAHHKDVHLWYKEQRSSVPVESGWRLQLYGFGQVWQSFTDAAQRRQNLKSHASLLTLKPWLISFWIKRVF